MGNRILLHSGPFVFCIGLDNTCVDMYQLEVTLCNPEVAFFALIQINIFFFKSAYSILLSDTGSCIFIISYIQRKVNRIYIFSESVETMNKQCYDPTQLLLQPQCDWLVIRVAHI